MGLEEKWLSEELPEREAAKELKERALKALEKTDMSGILEAMSGIENTKEAGAALRAVLAERIAECAAGATREAKRRGTKLGAAAIIIAAARK